MSKYHKYILLGFILICLTSLILTFCPSKKYFSNEVILNEDTKEYIKEKNFDDYNNYDLNFIEENNLSDDVIKGRNISINDKYFDNYDYMSYMGNSYITEEMKGNINVSTTYFKNSNYVLLNIEGSYNDIFLNNKLKVQIICDYENFADEIFYHYYVASSNIMIEYKDKEYSLGKYNDWIDCDSKYKLAILNLSCRVSLFIDISNFLDSNLNVFTFEVFRHIDKKEKAYIFGLNTIKENDVFYERRYVEYISNYIEIGG